jgi:hypothetical protein
MAIIDDYVFGIHVERKTREISRESAPGTKQTLR